MRASRDALFLIKTIEVHLHLQGHTKIDIDTNEENHKNSKITHLSTKIVVGSFKNYIAENQFAQISGLRK